MQLKVAYVDDEQELLDLFKDLFSQKDVEIQTYSDPKQAIEAILASRPDILFLDYRMPGTTGIDLAQKVEKSIPKFLLTGELSITEATDFVQVFHKPYPMADISKVLSEALAAKRNSQR